MAAELWFPRGEPIHFPAECPLCGKYVADHLLEVRDLVDGRVWEKWPHCGRCAARSSLRRRATSIVGWSFLAGALLLGLAIALQFMETGLSDSILLAFGFLSFLGVAGSAAIGVTIWLVAKGGWGPIIGVSFRGLYWPGSDVIPLPGEPQFVGYRFSRIGYRDVLHSMNMETSDRDVQAMLSRCRAELALSELRSPDEEMAVSESRQVVKDWLSRSWDVSFTVALIVALLCGYLAVKLAVTGGTGWIQAYRWSAACVLALAAFCATGYVLLIETARRIMGVLTTVAAATVTMYLAWRMFLNPGFWKGVSWLFLCGILWLAAWSFHAAPARRLCSRWGRLEKFFKG